MNEKEILTKNERVKAFVRHIFINQQFLFSLNAATKKPYKITMLKLGD